MSNEHSGTGPGPCEVPGLDAYIAGMTAIRDQLEAEYAQIGWQLGLLPTDPLTGGVPGLAILTELGLRQVELQKAACATYVITESTTLHLIDPAIFAGADPGAPGTWCIVALPFFLDVGATDPWLLGSHLVCVPPRATSGEPAPADVLVVMNSDGVEQHLQTPTGPARWFLVPGYTYTLQRDRTIERWSIREIVNTGGDWAQLLLPPT